jgi:hypothetical protein
MNNYVLIRTYSAGVHVGEMVSRDGKEVVLKNARRIWSWHGRNTLNEIAALGVGKGSRVSQPSPGTVTLTEAIEIIDCAPGARENLEAATWA